MDSLEQNVETMQTVRTDLNLVSTRVTSLESEMPSKITSLDVEDGMRPLTNDVTDIKRKLDDVQEKVDNVDQDANFMRNELFGIMDARADTNREIASLWQNASQAANNFNALQQTMNQISQNDNDEKLQEQIDSLWRNHTQTLSEITRNFTYLGRSIQNAASAASAQGDYSLDISQIRSSIDQMNDDVTRILEDMVTKQEYQVMRNN